MLIFIDQEKIFNEKNLKTLNQINFSVHKDA